MAVGALNGVSDPQQADHSHPAAAAHVKRPGPQQGWQVLSHPEKSTQDNSDRIDVFNDVSADAPGASRRPGSPTHPKKNHQRQNRAEEHALVPTVPQPCPPWLTGCDRRSPTDAPSGRVRM